MCARRRRRGSRLGLWLTARRRMWRVTFCEGNCPSRAVAIVLLNSKISLTLASANL